MKKFKIESYKYGSREVKAVSKAKAVNNFCFRLSRQWRVSYYAVKATTIKVEELRVWWRDFTIMRDAIAHEKQIRV